MHYIDDGCEWINDVVCCKKCKEPVHIAFFHDEPVSFCPKCKKMYYYPYSKELLKAERQDSTKFEVAPCGKQFRVKTDSCSGIAHNGKFEIMCRQCKRFVP